MKPSALALAIAGSILLSGCFSRTSVGTPQPPPPPPPESVGPQTAPPFPWPPPRASATSDIPRRLLEDAKSLGDVDGKLLEGLNQAGYGERSYYWVPGGFALATRIERMDDDGAPHRSDRWNLNPSLKKNFDLFVFLKALVSAPVGRYRVFVFTVTSQPYTFDSTEPSYETAIRWAGGGASALTSEIAQEPFTKEHSVKALIYEFEKSAGKERQMDPSALSGADHIARSGIQSGLEGR